MAYYDGAINIDTKLDTQGIEDGLSKLKNLVTKGALAIGASVSAGIAGAVKSGIDFESAFAGVRKTVDATEIQLASMRKEILQMSNSIPLAATEIAGIAESAGQLGIKTESITAFTKTMADLGVATNMTSEQAATSLARLANITQMPQENFDRLGATIVDLGNNLATTESEIVDMALRLAGTGNQVGMTEAQILSFSGALSSVGIYAEAGGTAFSTLMSNMQLAAATGGTELQNFAAVAGMTAEEFKKSFEQDAAQAIISFIQGLSRAQENGTSAIQILDSMGISEIRLRDSLLRAAGASDVFTEAIQIGNEAWENNTALTKEAEQRYDTVESKLTLLKNGLANLGIAIYEGIQEPFKTSITTATEQIGTLTTSIQSGGLKSAVASVGELFGNLISTVSNLTVNILPGLINTLSFLGENLNIIIPLITAAVVGINAYKVAANAAKTAQTLLNSVMSVNPINLLISAFAALTAGMLAYTSASGVAYFETEKIIKSYEDLKQQADETAESELAQAEKVTILRDRLFELDRQIKSGILSEEESRQAKEDLKTVTGELTDIIPDLKIEINKETGALSTQIGTIVSLTNSYIQLARAKGMANAYQSKIDAASSALVDLKDERERLINASKFPLITEEYLEDMQGKPSSLFKNPFQGFSQSDVNFAQLRNIEKIDQEIQNVNNELDGYINELGKYQTEIESYQKKEESLQEELNTGGGSSYSIGGGSSSSQARKEAEDAEQIRKSQAEAYKMAVESEMEAEERKFEALKRRGKVSQKDYLANIVYRAETYRGYADDVLKQDYMTAEEQEAIRKEWIEKAEDLETEYLLGYIEMDKAALDKQRKNGEISQKEYWQKLIDLRDQYFAEGSDSWLQYTDEVTEMQKEAITEVYTAIANEAESSLGEIEQAQNSLAEKLKGFGNLFDQNVIKGAGENGTDITFTTLHNFDKDNEALLEYQEALEQLREKGKAVLGDDFPKFFNQFSEMSIEEGTNAVNALLSASDKEFNSALSGWQEYQRNSEAFAKNFYKDDYESLKNETMQKLREAFDDVPDTFLENGELAADAFGEGFLDQIQNVFNKISDAINTQMIGITPQLSVVGGVPAGASVVNSNNTTTYNLISSGESVHQQLQAIDAAETKNKLRGR